MNFFGTIYQTVLDALFPLTNEEREILTMTPEMAFEKLPQAPEYSEPLPGMNSIFAYKDERVAKLVWNIKYKKSKVAVKIGGYALWRRLVEIDGQTQDGNLKLEFESGVVGVDPESSALQSGKILLIPLPITDRRRKERGYNQTELLVDEIARLDTEKRFMISKDLLVRTKHVARQTLKGREERLEGSKGIFAVNKKTTEQLNHRICEQLKNGAIEQFGKDMSSNTGEFKCISVVIIDDVITTGSTMKEACAALRAAGFTHVTGLSVAH